VQVDSVNTLARAHDLILWSRRPTYRPAALRWLNDRARATFEHWTHDASIIPMAFHPHWRLRFARDRDRLHRALEGLARRPVPWRARPRPGPCLGQRPGVERRFRRRAGREIDRLVGLAPLEDRAGIPLALGRVVGDPAGGVPQALRPQRARGAARGAERADPGRGGDGRLGLFCGSRPAGLRHERRTGGVLGPRDALGGEGLGRGGARDGPGDRRRRGLRGRKPATLGGVARHGGGGGSRWRTPGRGCASSAPSTRH
jgi:hypothetical protein